MKILLFLFCLNVSAENYIHLGMVSKHPNTGYKFHNLIGVEINNKFLHKFENSQGDTSYYGGFIDRDVFCYSDFCAGYSVGVMQGYKHKKLSSAGFVVLSWGKDGFGVDISYLPDVVSAIQFRFTDKAFQQIGIIEPWYAHGYVEVSYDSFDPDGESSLGYERSNGVTYDAKIYLTNDVYLKGSYTTTDSGAQPDHNEQKFTPVWQTGKPSQIDSRGYIQIGKDFNILSVGISYNQISIQESYLNRASMKITSTPQTHYRGFGAHISKDYQLTDDWSFYAEAAIVDDLITDLRITIETRYKITDNFEITVRWIDWERWNMSQAQLGWRWNL